MIKELDYSNNKFENPEKINEIVESGDKITFFLPTGAIVFDFFKNDTQKEVFSEKKHNGGAFVNVQVNLNKINTAKINNGLIESLSYGCLAGISVYNDDKIHFDVYVDKIKYVKILANNLKNVETEVKSEHERLKLKDKAITLKKAYDAVCITFSLLSVLFFILALNSNNRLLILETSYFVENLSRRIENTKNEVLFFFIMWFILAIISIISLFLSALQIKKINAK